MDLSSTIAKLHPFERAVLPVLKTHQKLAHIIEHSGLQEIEVIRGLQWLENKEALKIITDKYKVVILDKNGIAAQQHGLPEKRLLQVLTDQFQSLQQLQDKTSLDTQECNAVIGLLKQQQAIEIEKKDQLYIKITVNGKTLQKQKSPAELLLTKQFPLPYDSLTKQEQTVLEELRKRKEILHTDEQKNITVTLTTIGKQLANADLGAEVINRLTPAMLKDGSWKKKNFRAYDVEINVPKTGVGRRHFDNDALQYIKRIWLDMGFKEMTGNYVQSAFWDLDALFVPQDHPAREMQDTFYLEGKAKLPPIWTKIKEVHENGANTGSIGWRYTFSQDEAQKILLRTHTTVLSAQTLSKLKKEDLPAKFFAVGKVFRNEALDWKHLFEFYQVDGIVIDPNANLKHLKGYLSRFYKKMGYTKVRMRPAHFPYTEPSMEVDVYHPGRKQWIELGGAGIFRPEVVKPLLGFECPVLAWGQGMGRIIMEYWNITDIRDLYKNDLKQLREAKLWLR
ncbi:phenylalanine--tRNA ligase subunit alpha [Candidatus Woesearchaeota archaeon]|nr:phenylalanine--tRNA ligase subunit alpha [Candidatus Woesearchaeota archaeon]